MKRKILALLALILALVLSLTLVSCGGNDDDDDDDDDDKGSSSSSGSKDKGQVTETVWNKYLALKNVFRYEFEYTRDEETEIEGQEPKSNTITGIYTYVDGSYLFSKNDGTDDRGEYDPSHVLDLPFSTPIASLISMCDFEFDYDEFNYDTKTKSYVLSERTELDELNAIFDFTVSVKFESNALVSISIDCVTSVDSSIMKGESTTAEVFTFTAFDFSENSSDEEDVESAVSSNPRPTSGTNTGINSDNSNNSNGNSYVGSSGGNYPGDINPNLNPYEVTRAVWEGTMELKTYKEFAFNFIGHTSVNGSITDTAEFTYSYHNNKYFYTDENGANSSYYAPFNPVDMPHMALEQTILWDIDNSSALLNRDNYSFDGREYSYVFTTEDFVNIIVTIQFENNKLISITMVSGQDTSDGLISRTDSYTFYDWE